MRVGILQTGKVNPALAGEHGEYPGMFERLLGPEDRALRFRTYPVVEEVFPETPGDCDAWLITGSKHGVYDDLPWIGPLKEFLRGARSEGVPVLGVCFGHQIVAEAFGGRAEKSAKGWGVGVHDYEVLARPSWMSDAPGTVSLYAVHQDQVTAVPEDATVLMRSEFCPYAMLAYGAPERPEALSIQPHPEFGRDFARALLETRAGAEIPDATAAAARESLARPVHAREAARWCAAYLRRAADARRAA